MPRQKRSSFPNIKIEIEDPISSKKSHDQLRLDATETESPGLIVKKRKKLPLTPSSENLNCLNMSTNETNIELKVKEEDVNSMASNGYGNIVAALTSASNFQHKSPRNSTNTVEGFSENAEIPAKENKTDSPTSKRFRVIMECELHVGTLCMFDIDQYWTADMIIKCGCPHRNEALQRKSKCMEMKN